MAYHIPQEKEIFLSTPFLKDFKKELDKIFKFESNATHHSHYTYITSTSGFALALEQACQQHGLSDQLYLYHESLDWQESDQLDEFLLIRMIKLGIILEN